MKPVIVGQAPSRTSDPREPLSGRSNARLAVLCVLSMPEFLAAFDRRNLSPEWFGNKTDGGDSPDLLGRRVILLGCWVKAAFRVDWPMFSFRPRYGGEVAWSPHPSGISRWWNDPLNVALAQKFWQDLTK